MEIVYISYLVAHSIETFKLLITSTVKLEMYDGLTNSTRTYRYIFGVFTYNNIMKSKSLVTLVTVV